MFDRTTNDCMLFSGSLNDLQDDCREVGYAREPNHASCDTVFPSNSSNGCYVSISTINSIFGNLYTCKYRSLRWLLFIIIEF